MKSRVRLKLGVLMFGVVVMSIISIIELQRRIGSSQSHSNAEDSSSSASDQGRRKLTDRAVTENRNRMPSLGKMDENLMINGRISYGNYLRSRLNVLIEALTLTESQINLAQQEIERRMTNYSILWEGSGPEVARQVSRSGGGFKPIESVLVGSLDQNQIKDLEEFLVKEDEAVATSVATRQLENLEFVASLSQDQKSGLFEVLRKAAQELRENKIESDLDEAFASSLPKDANVDIFSLGLDELLAQYMLAASKDRDKAKEQFFHAVADKIDRKLEEAAPILSRQQLAEYKEELNSKGLGLYRGLVNGQ